MVVVVKIAGYIKDAYVVWVPIIPTEHAQFTQHYHIFQINTGMRIEKHFHNVHMSICTGQDEGCFSMLQGNQEVQYRVHAAMHIS